MHETPQILVESAIPASLVQDMLMPMSSGEEDYFAGEGLGEGEPDDWLGGFVGAGRGPGSGGIRLVTRGHRRTTSHICARQPSLDTVREAFAIRQNKGAKPSLRRMTAH